jgi:NAD(P)-dependent dehydrogenase (short-subunit alcohol dehydrogenase family)
MGVLAGKTIVVMGGTSGLGLAGAGAIAREGAQVVVAGRADEHLAAATAALGRNVIVLTGDAADPEFAQHLIDTAIQRHGALDGLYHVAGGSARRAGDGPLHELSDEGLDAALDQNLKSLIYSNRAAVRAMLERKSGGAIVNVSSVLAYAPAASHFATHAYAACKAGAIGFTRSCAAYYAPHNIRFNVVAPALVRTPMAGRAAGDEAIRRFIRTKQPLDGGRMGEPPDLDGAVLYLLSDAAKFVTGQILAIDGGWGVSDGQVSP